MVYALVVTLVLLLQAAAVVCAWRAIVSARTPQGALAWVIFLISAPYIGVLLYLFLGHHRYRGYLISRRESEKVIDGLKRLAQTRVPSRPLAVNPLPFERLADLPVVGGNRLTPLIDGAASFEAIFAAIDAAERYVLVQFYIVHDDAIGRELRDHLIAAAQRGVRVMFMTDAIGSHDLPKSYYTALREAGIDVADPKDGKRPRHRFQINFRNHRKTVVVDGCLGFTGGLNVGDEYLGRDPKMGNWRDTHLELRGPVVSQLQLVFAEDWHWARKDLPADLLNWTPAPEPEDKAALIVPTGPGDKMETGALFFFSAIAAARERVWIASPYCVPDTDVLSALKHAALSGLDVRLVVPEKADHLISWLAAFAYFDELREAGVQIWRYGDGFMHQKVILVDTAFAAIGTTNLDNRSFRLNFEAMAAMFDPDAAQAVERFLEDDLTRSSLLDKPLAAQPLKVRMGGPVARLFAPLL